MLDLQDLRQKIERTQARIDQLGSNVENESQSRELQQRVKKYRGEFENAKKEVAALEKQAKQKASTLRQEQARVAKIRAGIAAKESERNAIEERLNNTKTLDELREQINQLQKQAEEDEAILQDTDASPSEREAARERLADRTAEELVRFQAQIDEREAALPHGQKSRTVSG